MPISPAAKPRRTPKQARSRATVDAILDATARVLTEAGYAGANTNRIAATAGVSIGSLYQFFPSKEALVTALRRRHAQQMRDMVREMVGAIAGMPLAAAVPRFVHAVFAAHLIDPALHRVLDQEVPRPDLADGREDIDADFRATIRAVLALHRAEILPDDLDIASLILVRMVDALVHAAVLVRPAGIDAQAVEREIATVILRYLQGARAR